MTFTLPKIRARTPKLINLYLTVCILPMLASWSVACSCGGPSVALKTALAVAEWRIQNTTVIFEGTVEKMELENWVTDLKPGDTVLAKPDSVRVTFSSVRLYRGQPVQFV